MPLGIALLASQYVGKDNLLKKMLGSQLALPDVVWRNLSFGWSGGFFLAGSINLIVAYQFSLDFWVSYKLIGGFALTLAYIIITMIYLYRGGYLKEDNQEVSKQ